MNWIGVVLGAVVGGLTAALFAPLVKRIWKTDRSQRIVFVLVFALALTLSRELLQPVVQRHYEAYVLDDELQRNPAFVTLKTYDASTYASIVASLKEQFKSGATSDEIVANSQALIQAVILKRLPTASDQATTTYMKVMMDEVRYLYANGTDRCFSLLFQSESNPQHIKQGELPKHLADADISALSEVLRTALVNPQQVPTGDNFNDVISTPALNEFINSNSAALGVLGQAKATLGDRRSDCKLTMDMYSEIFKLPTPQAGLAIRYMLGTQQ